MKQSYTSLKGLVAIAAGLLLCLLALSVAERLSPALPSGRRIISLFNRHEAQLGVLADLAERHCSQMSGFSEKPLRSAIGEQDALSYESLVSEIGWDIKVFCQDSGNIRFVLAEWGILLTVGPERIVGLEMIVGNPDKEGLRVGDVDAVDKNKEEIYLQHIKGRWFVFYQYLS